MSENWLQLIVFIWSDLGYIFLCFHFIRSHLCDISTFGFQLMSNLCYIFCL